MCKMAMVVILSVDLSICDHCFNNGSSVVRTNSNRTAEMLQALTCLRVLVITDILCFATLY